MLQTNNKDLWTSKPVVCASKKKVNSAYTPNSYRIFQDEISDKKAKITRAQTADGSRLNVSPKNATGMAFFNSRSSSYWGDKHQEFTGKPGYISQHPKEPSRRNCPHPSSAQFLRSNVHMLNEVIPKISSDSTSNDQTNWYYHADKNNNSETAGRSTFRKSVTPLNRSTSNTSNGNPYNLPKIVRRKPPLGADWILRHNTCDDKKFLEHISYRHGYNRRFYRHEPIRGKLPGNFVWQEVRE